MAVYIALGSNLGDREGNLRRALELLREQGIRPVRVAPFVETKPYGVTDQPDFLNTVAAVETDLEPLDLLHALLATERQMGRVRLRHWGERNIDLDLLLYDDRCLDTAELVLPHRDMQNRDFVLQPLGKTVAELWQDLRRRTKDAAAPGTDAPSAGTGTPAP